MFYYHMLGTEIRLIMMIGDRMCYESDLGSSNLKRSTYVLSLKQEAILYNSICLCEGLVPPFVYL